MSTRVYLRSLVAVVSAGVLVSSVVAYVVCLKGASVPMTAVAIGVTLVPFLAAGSVIGSRWQRSNGIVRQRPKLAAYGLVAAMLTFDIVATVLEQQTYRSIHSRLVEALLAFAIGVPSSILFVRVSKGLRPPAQAREVPVFRFGFYALVITYVMFVANQVLVLGLPLRHQYPELQPLAEFNIAMRFLLIFAFPAFLVAFWRRLATSQESAPSGIPLQPYRGP